MADNDPMDSPPTDHGSDRYDYIEIDAPEGTPNPPWLTDNWMPCLDCRANAFLTFDGEWHVTVAHQDGCPRLRREES